VHTDIGEAKNALQLSSVVDHAVFYCDVAAKHACGIVCQNPKTGELTKMGASGRVLREAQLEQCCNGLVLGGIQLIIWEMAEGHDFFGFWDSNLG
jgi:hypothetical protein